MHCTADIACTGRLRLSPGTAGVVRMSRLKSSNLRCRFLIFLSFPLDLADTHRHPRPAPDDIEQPTEGAIVQTRDWFIFSRSHTPQHLPDMTIQPPTALPEQLVIGVLGKLMNQ